MGMPACFGDDQYKAPGSKPALARDNEPMSSALALVEQCCCNTWHFAPTAVQCIARYGKLHLLQLWIPDVRR